MSGLVSNSGSNSMLDVCVQLNHNFIGHSSSEVGARLGTSCISLASFFRTMFSFNIFFFTKSLFFDFEAMASVPICERRIFIRENDNI